MKLIKMKGRGYMLEVNAKEGLSLALSLLAQIEKGSNNDGRREYMNCDGGPYFSIAVNPIEGGLYGAYGEPSPYTRAVLMLHDMWAAHKYHKHAQCDGEVARVNLEEGEGA